MRYNPLTREWEDDAAATPGIGAPMPTQPLKADSLAPRQAAGEAGGGQSLNVTVTPPMQPSHETTTTAQKMGAPTAAAIDQVTGAQDEKQKLIDRDTELKVKEADAKLADATARKLLAEQERQALEKKEAERQQLITSNVESDRRSVEQSAREEAQIADAGQIRGAAKVFAKVLGVIQALATGAAAAGSRGAAAWTDGNPVVEHYEKERNAAIATAERRFKASEKYRAAMKEGRGKAEALLNDEIIAVKNRFESDRKTQALILEEKLAKLTPDQARVAGELAKAADKELAGKWQAETFQAYDKKTSTTDRETPVPAGSDAAAKTQAVKDKADIAKMGGKAKDAIAAIEEIEAIVQKNGRPLAFFEGEAAGSYNSAVKRAAKKIAPMESGNPDAEASDPVINNLASRLGPQSLKDYHAQGGKEGLLKRLAEEKAAIQRRVATAAEATGQPAPGAAEKPKGPPPVTEWSEGQLRRAYKAATDARATKATAEALAELKRRGLKP